MKELARSIPENIPDYLDTFQTVSPAHSEVLSDNPDETSSDFEPPHELEVEASKNPNTLTTSRLVRAATTDEVAHQFRDNDATGVKGFVLLNAMVTMYGIRSAFENDPESEEFKGFFHASFGSYYASRGDFFRARKYLWSAVSTEGRDDPSWDGYNAFGTLAWIESDPENAARLLELSCSGPRPFEHLFGAVALCKVTGSTDLEEYYQARIDRIRELQQRSERLYEIELAPADE